MVTAIFIIVLHWVADFIFQAESWALSKSKYSKSLIKHTLMYSLMWVFPVLYMTNDLPNTIIFVVITYIAHTVTDYFTSKIVSNYFEKEKLGSPIPNWGAFSMIGLDQVLHYVQLFLTWKFLFGDF